MPRYTLTPQAKQDVREIVAYVRKRSRQGAKRVSSELTFGFKRLAEFPEIGHVREDVDDPSVRFWSVFDYLIVYRPSSRPLEILRVIHGARDVGGAYRRGH